jgi:AraC-like DNA-binding protein
LRAGRKAARKKSERVCSRAAQEHHDESHRASRADPSAVVDASASEASRIRSLMSDLDATRRELAEQYLGQVDLTLLEVAYLLGFADPSNFFRAFRRWFGETPGEYRSRRGLAG